MTFLEFKTDINIFFTDAQTGFLEFFDADDIVALSSESKFLHEHIKGSRLVGFSCGHVVLSELPRELTEVLIQFLRQIF